MALGVAKVTERVSTDGRSFVYRSWPRDGAPGPGLPSALLKVDGGRWAVEAMRPAAAALIPFQSTDRGTHLVRVADPDRVLEFVRSGNSEDGSWRHMTSRLPPTGRADR
jgi:hypothetical protein